ncbi:MAG: hypothetical protein AUK53_00650 [Betaproteobacteria bacterium CG2_30_59_46]|nr:MAG: hypothetical protein AUK53_00650 [Betaproteobacteria bacterium CG2_30_59_46]
MGEIAVPLDGEGEIRRSLVTPVLESAFALVMVEGSIDLDGIEMARVESEPVLMGNAAIEAV